MVNARIHGMIFETFEGEREIEREREVTNGNTRNKSSIGWFKGKIAGKSHISWENLWFPVKIFPSTNPLICVQLHIFLVKLMV